MCKHIFSQGLYLPENTITPSPSVRTLTFLSHAFLHRITALRREQQWEREHSRFVRRPCVVDIHGKMHPPTDFPDDNGVCIVPQQPISSSQNQTQATGTQLVRRCLDLKRSTFRSSESEGKTGKYQCLVVGESSLKLKQLLITQTTVKLPACSSLKQQQQHEHTYYIDIDLQIMRIYNKLLHFFIVYIQ